MRTPEPWPEAECSDHFRLWALGEVSPSGQHVVMTPDDYAHARSYVNALAAAGVTKPEGVEQLAAMAQMCLSWIESDEASEGKQLYLQKRREWCVEALRACGIEEKT